MSKIANKLVKITEVKKVLKGDLTIESIGLEVKPFVSINTKSQVIDVIFNACRTVDENNIDIIDYTSKRISEEMVLIRRYTNIDFSTVDKIDDIDLWNEKYIEFYDILTETGIIDYVLDNIPMVELERVYSLIELEVEQLERVNLSTSLAINRVVDKVLGEVTKFMSVMPSDAKEISPLIEAVKDIVMNKDEIEGDDTEQDFETVETKIED